MCLGKGRPTPDEMCANRGGLMFLHRGGEEFQRSMGDQVINLQVDASIIFANAS
jgi:hypothetical protein